MAVVAALAPEKPKLSITVPENMVKGLADLKLDEEITIVFKAKVVEIGRNTWEKKKPIQVRMDIISGKLSGAKIMHDIEDAETVKDLEKAMHGEKKP